MKAVILSAGKGTRMGDLSLETPKPMLKVLGKTLLEHKLDMMPDSIDEVIIVVGHLKEQIESLGEKYGRLKIKYVEQVEMNGTAGALWACREHLSDEKKFLVMMGDDIYCKEDMEECLSKPWAILIKKIDSLLGKGKVVFDSKGAITDIIERSPIEEVGYICAAMYALTPKIFEYEMVQIPGGEYGLPQTILSAKNNFKINAVKAKFWLQITKPEDLEMAEEHLNMRSLK